MNVINVEKRSSHAKPKQLRRAGFVPCCVYGGKLMEPISIQMDRQTATQLFRSKREGSKVELDLEGHLIHALIKEKMKNTVNEEIIHFSFQALSEDQRVNSTVRIVLKNADVVPGVIEQSLYEIPFSSFPADMIDTVTIDLSGMPTGTVLTVGDIPELKNEKIELQTAKDSIVLRIGEKRSVSIL